MMRPPRPSVRVDPYVGLAVTNQPGVVYLSRLDVLRLVDMEARNRRRARKKGASAVDVDFIAQLVRQDWLCVICKRPMDPFIPGPEPQSISLEHDPALSVGMRHDPGSVRGAHFICNVTKAHTSDTPRAAKINRVKADEAEHAERMALKAKGKPRPKGSIRSAPFSKRPPHLRYKWPSRSMR